MEFKLLISDRFILSILQNVSDYEQEIQQSQPADRPKFEMLTFEMALVVKYCIHISFLFVHTVDILLNWTILI